MYDSSPVRVTIGNSTNSTEPSTDVNHSPRNGLRQRWTSFTPGGGRSAKLRHSPAGKPYSRRSEGSVRRSSCELGSAGVRLVMAEVSPVYQSVIREAGGSPRGVIHWSSGAAEPLRRHRDLAKNRFLGSREAKPRPRTPSRNQ